MKKLIPYSVYLPVEHYEKIRVLAAQRKASALVRDAICMILDGSDPYNAGYNQALRYCVKRVNSVKEIEHIAVQGKYLSTLLSEEMEGMEV